MNNYKYDRRVRLVISIVSLLALIPVQAIMQYEGMPPNEILRGYDLSPFQPGNLVFISATLCMIYLDIGNILKKNYKGNFSISYYVLLALSILGAVLIVTQSYAFLDHYYGNGKIYIATYFPLMIQVLTVSLIIVGFVMNIRNPLSRSVRE